MFGLCWDHCFLNEHYSNLITLFAITFMTSKTKPLHLITA